MDYVLVGFFAFSAGFALGALAYALVMAPAASMPHPGPSNWPGEARTAIVTCRGRYLNSIEPRRYSADVMDALTFPDLMTAQAYCHVGDAASAFSEIRP